MMPGIRVVLGDAEEARVVVEAGGPRQGRVCWAPRTRRDGDHIPASSGRIAVLQDQRQLRRIAVPPWACAKGFRHPELGRTPADILHGVFALNTQILCTYRRDPEILSN